MQGSESMAQGHTSASCVGSEKHSLKSTTHDRRGEGNKCNEDESNAWKKRRQKGVGTWNKSRLLGADGGRVWTHAVELARFFQVLLDVTLSSHRSHTDTKENERKGQQGLRVRRKGKDREGEDKSLEKREGVGETTPVSVLLNSFCVYMLATIILCRCLSPSLSLSPCLKRDCLGIAVRSSPRIGHG